MTTTTEAAARRATPRRLCCETFMPLSGDGRRHLRRMCEPTPPRLAPIHRTVFHVSEDQPASLGAPRCFSCGGDEQKKEMLLMLEDFSVRLRLGGAVIGDDLANAAALRHCTVSHDMNQHESIDNVVKQLPEYFLFRSSLYVPLSFALSWLSRLRDAKHPVFPNTRLGRSVAVSLTGRQHLPLRTIQSGCLSQLPPGARRRRGPI